MAATLDGPRPSTFAARERHAGWAALALLVALELLTAWRLRPPAARSALAPEREFSALRAVNILQRLIPNGEPHPTGSHAQRAVRARLLRELDALELSPEVQSGVACGAEGTCAELHNVVAHVHGTQMAPEVVLVAHYDSVSAGPGAGDDGQGVASLIEIARALRATPPEHGVVLLFTDGEELGTLGARLFMAEHPLHRQIRVALNVEGRGSRGPSLMFETTPGSDWLVGYFAASPRPVASSLFGALYRALPAGTDLSVFAEHGVQGLNFAFVSGIENYHTSRDTLANLDLGSLQQQGDSVLATTRELASRGARPPASDAVFFDILSLALVRLPGALMPWMALCAICLFALAFVCDLRRRARRYSPADLGRACMGLLAAFALPAIAGALLGIALERYGALPAPFIAQPAPLLLSLCCFVLAGSAAALRFANTPERRRALWDITWLCWLGAGASLLLLLPEASYLLLIPAACAAVVRCRSSVTGDRATPLALALGCAAAAAVLLLPIASLLLPVFGIPFPMLLAVFFAVIATPFGPLWGPVLGRHWVAAGLTASATLFGLGQLLFAPYTAASPQGVSLALALDAAGDGRWHADAWGGPLPAALRRAADFSAHPVGHQAWPDPQLPTYTAPAAVSRASELAYRLESPAPNVLHLHFQAPPELWALSVSAPGAALDRVTWRGQVLEFSDGMQSACLVPDSERSMQVELAFAGPAPERLELWALSLGLPEQARALLAARAPTAVASGWADLTLVEIEARRR